MGKQDWIDNSIVIIHNPSMNTFDRLVKIQVPHKAIRVEIWDFEKKEFVVTMSDTLELHHKTNIGVKTTDYELMFKYKLLSNQVGYAKLSLSKPSGDGNTDDAKIDKSKAKSSLELLLDDDAPLRFKFKHNLETTSGNSKVLEQVFDIDVGYYAASEDPKHNMEG